MVSGGVIILHDNARSHVAVACQTLLRQICWEVLKQPSYSLDFSPCAYHIFGPLQKALKRWRVLYDNEVQAAVENWFHNLYRSFFTKSIHNVVDHWDTCSNL
ncbi:hypothetical protein TNCV_3418601 [Trichonephila clavipes]|nr:hypothetical protein TNCV_3418601 [Trichonephila clavipes]